MASMRDIKRRKESVQSTGQITKAMKLVSSVKLQKAKVGAEVSKPYFDAMYEAVAAMIAKSGEMSHPFFRPFFLSGPARIYRSAFIFLIIIYPSPKRKQTI